MNKFWKYFTIVILLILGIFCIGLLYLFFVPGSNLFKITYISKNEIANSNQYFASSVSKLIINNQNYNTKITSSDDGKIQVYVHNSAFGYTTIGKKDLIIEESLTSNILTVNIHEPSGFIFENGSYLEIKIPKNTPINLTIENSKSKTEIDSPSVKINNLSYTTKTGDFVFKNGSILGDLNIQLERAYFEIQENVTTNFNNTNLKIEKGTFSATKESLGDVNILSNKRGVIEIDSCENLNQNLDIAGGRIKINNAEHVDFKSSSTNVYINNISNGAIISTSSGKIELGTVVGHSNITTSSGDVKVETNNSPIDLVTTTGNITILSAKARVNPITSNGTITIHFDEDAQAYSSSNEFRAIYANVKSGKIIATGVEHINCIIEDAGNINIEMKDVAGSNYIETRTGSAKVVINYQSVYTLETEASDKGQVKVNILQIPEYGGYTQQGKRTTNVNSNSAVSDKLFITTTTGNILVLDTKLN